MKELTMFDHMLGTIVMTHIDNIKIGDTIIHNEKLMTVSESSFNRSDFMGLSLFGDSYALGHKKVTRFDVFHAKPTLKVVA